MDILNIEKFHHGLILSADNQDIPDDAASASTSIDGDASEGELMGMPVATIKSSDYGTHAISPTFITGSDGKHDLIYYNPLAGAVEAIQDFYGSATGTSLLTGLSPDRVTMVSQNKVAHIGQGPGTSSIKAPLWVGHIDHGQFGGAAPGLVYAFSKLDRNVGVTDGSFYMTFTESAGSSPRFFAINTRIRYAMSFEYDGYQESPLYFFGSHLMTADCNAMTIVVTAYGTPPNKRISAVNIYRADSPDNSDANIGYSRLVKRIDINDTSWYASGDNHTFTFSDTGEAGVSYEGSTGMPETVTENRIWYGVSCMINSCLIIANCNHAILNDASHMLFKSKPGCFNMIDWTNDFVRLPFIPKALATFNGRIYAFDDNRYAKINPDGLIIEEVYEGAGCVSQTGVVVTEYGMFFCNKSNIWLHDGREPKPIGNYIRKSDGVTSWQDMDFSIMEPIVLYNTQRNSVLFMAGFNVHAGDGAVIWTYHITRERWDFATQEYGYFGGFSGKNGEVYVNDGATLSQLFASTTRSSWSYTTKTLTFGDATQRKALYKIQTSGSGTPTVEYSLDGGEFVTTADGLIPANNMYKKTIQVRLSGAGTVIVKSLGIIYRKLIGKR